MVDQKGLARLPLGRSRDRVAKGLRRRRRRLLIESLEVRRVLTGANEFPTLDEIADQLIDEDTQGHLVSLSGITAGGDEVQAVRVTAVSSQPQLIPHPTVSYQDGLTTAVLELSTVADQSGDAYISVFVEDAGNDGDLDTFFDNGFTSRSFVVHVSPVNDLPTIAPISDLLLSEDAESQIISIENITAGGGEQQPLTLAISSSNLTLIETLELNYNAGETTGSVRFQPSPNQSGVSTITITAEDGGLDGDLATTGDNLTFARTFDVTVTAVNDDPTLDELLNLTIDEDAAEQTVNLTGITAGGGESQPLRVTATSSIAGLIPDPTVSYTSDDTVGTLQFTPIADQSGVATITVIAEDGGLDGDLATTGDNLTFTRTFDVTVTAVNDVPTLDELLNLTIDEDAAEQTVNLTGITAGGGESQPLRVTATSSIAGLIPDPMVSYTSDDTVGTLQFTPIADQSGVTTITVRVEDGGFDGDLNTSGDNEVWLESFEVTVTPVNDAPFFSMDASKVIDEDSPKQAVTIEDISVGAFEDQPSRFLVTSSDPSLLSNLEIKHSGDSQAELLFTPAENQHGTTSVTVTLEDAGADGDLATTQDNISFASTISITVNSVNDPPSLDTIDDLNIVEDDSKQSVLMTGINAGGNESQPIRISVSSAPANLITEPSVIYTSGDSSGRIEFTPVANAFGSVILEVTVEDAGDDGDFETTGDNESSQKSFTVYIQPVNDAPTLEGISDQTLEEDATQQTINLSGISDGGSENQPLRVTAVSDNTALIADPSVTYTSGNATGSLSFIPLADQSGTATITVTVEDGGLDGELDTVLDNLSSSISFVVVVSAVNDPPTINAISDVTVDEDSGPSTINLTGISAGGGEQQTVRITASSSEAALISDPVVEYVDGESVGTLRYTPLPNQSGESIISVTVEDGGEDNDLSTIEDNLFSSLSFKLQVTAVNDTPTLGTIDAMTILEDESEQVVGLAGIGAGGDESQPLRVTAVSSDPSLIPSPVVSYASAAETGTLRFTPSANQYGTSTITVTVEDGGLDGDLSTSADNETFSESFDVVVNAVNDIPTLENLSDLAIDEDADQQTVTLSGITAGGDESQPLRVTAVSSNQALIPDPVVTYTSADQIGKIRFTPLANQFGTSSITVTLEDAGFDGDFGTLSDNQRVTQTFTITVNSVNDRPTIDTPSDVISYDESKLESVAFTGITAGGGESQSITIKYAIDNPTVIGDPAITDVSPDGTAVFNFVHVVGASGVAAITLTVTDDGGESISKTFDILVNPVNEIPSFEVVEDVTVDEDSGEKVVSLAGINAGSGEEQLLRLTAISSNSSLIADPQVVYVDGETSGELKFTPVKDQAGTANITVRLEDAGFDGDFATASDNETFTRTFVVIVNAVNDVPTLDALDDLSIDEDAAEQTVGLAGISAGGGEGQPLRVTASSSNKALIADPTVNYTIPNATGSLRFTPVADQYGTATITVTVEDGGLDGEFSTFGDNLTVTRTFDVSVNSVDDPPTVATISDLVLEEDAGEQVIGLIGITAGGDENQPLLVTAVSSNPSLIPDPNVTYTSADETGTLRFTPLANQSGTSTITVTVEDGGFDGDLQTAGDNLRTQETFEVRIDPVNDAPTISEINDLVIDEDSDLQTLLITGINAGGGETQDVRVTAVSGNSSLIPSPLVSTGKNSLERMLRFQPQPDQWGSAVITVTVEDAGLDGFLSTGGDNGKTTETFTVTVNPVNDPPAFSAISDVVINEDAGDYTINVSEISGGGGETQDLSLTAVLVDSSQSVISDLTVDYNAGETTGTISFSTLPEQHGEVRLRVKLEDGGLDNDLATSDGNETYEQEVLVLISEVNDPPTLRAIANTTIDEDSGGRTIDLYDITAGGGESQPLRVTAASSNPSLIANPTVSYQSPGESGELFFTPLANQFGTTTITVTVVDGGNDGNLSTTADNGTAEETFVVSVTPVNDPPGFDSIDNLSFDEDGGSQTVSLNGITSGVNEQQSVRWFVSVADSTLIAASEVSYSDGASSGSFQVTPADEAFGVTSITVQVEDAGVDNDFTTVEDNLSYDYTFDVEVLEVNDTPTLAVPSDRTIEEDSGEQTVVLSGITAGGDENQPLRVTAVSSNQSLFADPSVSYASADETGTLLFTPLPNQSGRSEVTVTVEDGGLDGNLETPADNAFYEKSFWVDVSPVNDVPTVDAVDAQSLSEDDAQRIVDLTGISAGSDESQPLHVTATSDNPQLIPQPIVTYASGDSSGTLSFKPAADQFGVTTITLRVEDGGLDDDLATEEDNGWDERLILVTVNPVNDPPAFSAISDVVINEDAGDYTINVSEISAGGGETQDLSLTAVFVDPSQSVISDLTVDYTAGETTGTISFSTLPEQHGEVRLRVKLEDGGLDNDLATTDGNETYEQEVLVLISEVNDPPTLRPIADTTVDEDSGSQTVVLYDIGAGGDEGQPLRVIATSSNLSLIADPTISYQIPKESGELVFTPLANQFGTSTITVTVEDGGIDGDLSTGSDNQSVSHSFEVTVVSLNDPPTLDALPDLVLDEDHGLINIPLSGITAGGDENQAVRISAFSDNATLTSSPAVIHDVGSDVGSVTLDTKAEKWGQAIITVTVEDAGLDGNIDTLEDNETLERSFVLTINEVNDLPTLSPIGDLVIEEDEVEQVINLAGITAGGDENQPLQVTAVSSNQNLFSNLTVEYASADENGTLRFTPSENLFGTSTITLTVEDGGFDGDLLTPDDNQRIEESFEVTVNPVNDAPTISEIDDLTIDEDNDPYDIVLTGISAGGEELQFIRFIAFSDDPTLIASPQVRYQYGASTAILTVVPKADAFGDATITVAIEDSGLDGKIFTSDDNLTSEQRTFTITVNPVNDAPTLGVLSDLSVDEDSNQQTVSLSGITSGGSESQPLRVMAVSSNQTLIPDPVVSYASADETGTLRFTPSANQSGTSTITVTVEDGGLDGDLSTGADNETFSQSFDVVVNAVNDAPTLGVLYNLTIDEDAGEQIIILAGIAAGGDESQPLRVMAVSSNQALIPDPDVSYVSADETGTLRFTPSANQSGTSTITVTVEDGGLDGDLSTGADNETFSQSFVVEVNFVNDSPTLGILSDLTIDEDSNQQTVVLSDITAGGDESQPLRVTAVSSNPSLIADPDVSYVSADDTGTLHFTPTANQSGTSTITVTVEDGGLDGDLSTGADNETFSQSFDVEVNAVNDTPTVGILPDLTIDEDSNQQAVSLGGITAGGGESQPLRVTAVSSNQALIPDPDVTYASADENGTLRFTPSENRFGTSTITVTVEDGGLDEDLLTTDDNLTHSVAFNVTVVGLNDPPGFDNIANQSVGEDNSPNVVNLSGIHSGAGESQPILLTAFSSNPSLVPNPSVAHSSQSSSGLLTYTLVPEKFGSSVITVRIEDAGVDNQFTTIEDNRSYQYSFNVTVTEINDRPTLSSVESISLSEDAVQQTVVLTGITAGGDESQPLRVTAVSSNQALISDPDVSYVSADDTGTLRFTPSANQSGISTITVTVEDGGLDGDLSTSADNETFSQSFEVVVNAVNDAPTLGVLSNLTIDEDAGEQIINLAGIAAGGDESQSLRVTAVSSNHALIPDPVVSYASADETGTLRFTPSANQSGTSTITVTVEDGGLDGDLSTGADNETFSQSFEVVVNAVNDAPTLGILSDLTIDEDSNQQTVVLSDITAGGDESQPLRVTAVSSNPSLIADPDVSYVSADDTGTLRFTPSANQSGISTITVTVEDGGLDGDLSTSADNETFSQSFEVVVNAVNDAPTLGVLSNLTIDEDAGEQIINLAGIAAGGDESQSLRVTAVSSNQALIADPDVSYVSADDTGTLRFTPSANQSGISTITVTVEDGGLDGDLSTSADNETFSQSFDVEVNAVNDTPTVGILPDLTIDEDSNQQTVVLSDITAGGDESQPLRVTAVSGNPSLIADPDVSYVSADDTGTLRFTPSANQSGISTITVTVEDGGLDGDLSTSADNETFSQSFEVVVNAVNDAPTLGILSDLTIDEDSNQQTVVLSDITAGSGESQPFRVTAVSSNQALIPDPDVTYASADENGTLRFTASANQSGTSTITVTVEDGGLDGDLSTGADNETFSESFEVVVKAVNDAPTLGILSDLTIDEDSNQQTVVLSDITAGGDESQPLRVTAVSSNPSLIADPDVSYVSADDTGTFRFTPTANQSGTSTITVTVEDGGLDGDLGTQVDNAIQSVAFVVNVTSVNDSPLLSVGQGLSYPDIPLDASIPAGPVGLAISELVSDEVPLSNFFDLEGGLPGVALTGFREDDLLAWFTIDSGDNWIQVDAASDAASLVLYANSTTRIYLQPKVDAPVTLANAMTIKAWDREGGYANGTIGVNANAAEFSELNYDVSTALIHVDTVAVDDLIVFSPGQAPTYAISHDLLLNNDILGVGVSGGSIPIQFDAQSVKLGTLVSADGFAYYTPPSEWFTGIDQFSYSLVNNGEETSATVTLLVGRGSNEFAINLDPTRSHDVSIIQRDGSLVVLDHSDSTEPIDVPLSLLPNTVVVNASPEFPSQISIKLPTSSSNIERFVMSGGNEQDTLSVIGQPNHSISLGSAENLSQSFVLNHSQGSVGLTEIIGSDFESLRLSSFETLSFATDAVRIGGELAIDQIAQPLSLAGQLLLAGGVFRYDGLLNLEAGSGVTGNGVLDSSVFGAVNSEIIADGTLAIGTSDRATDFTMQGTIEVLSQSLFVESGVNAKFSGVLTLGSDSVPGSLYLPSGAEFDSSSIINGYGSIDSSEGSTQPVTLNVNGLISGDSSSEPITIALGVTGRGEFSNAVIGGSYSPGPSVSSITHGVVSFTASSTTTFEIGGREVGSEFDRLVFQSLVLEGDLVLSLSDGFIPTPGDKFELISTTELISGKFESISLPPADSGTRLVVDRFETSVVAEAIFEVNDSFEIVSSTLGSLVIRHWDGSTVSIAGNELTVQLRPDQSFIAPGQWVLESVTSDARGWTQVITDGVSTIRIQGSDWTNYLSPSDINQSGDLTPVDVLQIINELDEPTYSDTVTGQLRTSKQVGSWPGSFLDQNGDGYVTPLDALRVINELQQGSSGGDDGTGGEGEDWAAGLTVLNVASFESFSYVSQESDREGSRETKRFNLASFEGNRVGGAATDVDQSAAAVDIRHDHVDAVDEIYAEIGNSLTMEVEHLIASS